MTIRCSVSGQSVTAMKEHKLHFKVGMRVVAAQVFEVEHIGHLPFPPDSEVLEKIFPAEARCEPSGKWACRQGEVDVLLAADSLNLFPRSEARRCGLDLQFSTISGNYLVMGQVCGLLPRTVSDQEKIRATVERHCQVRTVSAQTSRPPVGVIQPLALAVSSPVVSLSSTTARSGSAAEARKTQGPRGQCSSVNVPRDIQSSGASQRGWGGTEAISKVDRPGSPYRRDGAPKRPSHLDVTVPREPTRPRVPPRKGRFTRVPWEGGFARVP